MNSNDNSEDPSELGLLQPLPAAAENRPIREKWYWSRRILAGNPFYLVSAALLLFGINRLSVDESFLEAETAKLAFNFSALQLYELLLVGVSIVLARRRIWYDSTLLFGLENLLVLAPFILVTQALLIGKGVAFVLSLTGTVLAALRFASLRKFIPELNMPPRLLGFGVLVLAVNLVVPVCYRSLLPGGIADFWEQPNQWCWLAVLPLLQPLANLLPPPQGRGRIAPQRSWLPIATFELWIAATAVHFWCITYIDKLPCPLYLLAPVLWALAWTAHNRIEDFLPDPAPAMRISLLIAPALATLFVAAHQNSHVFLALTILNIIVYVRLWLTNRNNRIMFQLLLGSVAALLAAIPLDPGRVPVPELSRGGCIAAAFGAFVLLQALCSRRPQIGVCGAIVASIIPTLLGSGPHFNLAAQTGLVFLLLHSLGWADAVHKGAATLRILGAVAWMVHSVTAAVLDPIQAAWLLTAASMLVGCAYLAARLIMGYWAAFVIPLGAAVSLLALPANHLVRKVLTSPAGLLAIIASFVLFGLGTLLALTKPRWHPPLPGNAKEID